MILMGHQTRPRAARIRPHRCWGRKSHRHLVFREIFPIETAHLQRMRQRLVLLSFGAGLAGVDVDDLLLAVDEAIANILQHAYAGTEAGCVGISVARGADDVMVVLGDSGSPFDFFAGPSLESTRPFKAGQRGGLGVFLIRNLVDRVGYLRVGDQNRLVLVRGRRPA